MLLDVSMPGVDGLEALPAGPGGFSPATRVVLYSGFEEQGLAEQARQLGAAAFIEKSTPVDQPHRPAAGRWSAGPPEPASRRRTAPAGAAERSTSGSSTSTSSGSARCSRRPRSAWRR